MRYVLQVSVMPNVKDLTRQRYGGEPGRAGSQNRSPPRFLGPSGSFRAAPLGGRVSHKDVSVTYQSERAVSILGLDRGGLADHFLGA
jgi:hypothetical protein